MKEALTRGVDRGHSKGKGSDVTSGAPGKIDLPSHRSISACLGFYWERASY